MSRADLVVVLALVAALAFALSAFLQRRASAHEPRERVLGATQHGLPGAVALLVLFVAQLAVAFALRADASRDIAALTLVAWGYLALAAGVMALNARAILNLVRTAASPNTAEDPAISAPPTRRSPDATH